jgi:hAT family C-terminal dimerisation region
LIGPISSATTLNSDLTLFVQPRSTLAIVKVRKQVNILRQRQVIKLFFDRMLLTLDKSTEHVRKPSLDTPTRWNSIYWMLQNYSDLYDQILATISRFPEHFTGFILSDNDLSLIRALLPILSRLQEYSVQLQADKTVTLSDALLILNEIGDLLQSTKTDLFYLNLSELQVGLDAAIAKLDKYYPKKPENDLGTRNLSAYWMYIFATILDPRLKLRIFKIRKYWTTTEERRIIERFKRVYREYQDRFEYSPEPLSQEATIPQKTLSMQLHERLAEQDTETDGNELNSYLNTLKTAPSTNILDYWRTNTKTYPILARIARDVLAINPTSAAIEREFSKASDITNPPKRNRLSKRRINQLCCLKSWLPQETSQIEEDLEEITSDDTDYDDFDDSK